MTYSDYEKALIRDRKKENEPNKEANKARVSIPKISKLITTPPAPKIGGDKTISFSVTDQVPLKDVLIELGRVAKIDIDIDPRVSGGIILNAKNRPLKEVIDRIASLGKLRYSYKNSILYFEPDLPYTKNYFVDFLSDSPLWDSVSAGITAITSKSKSTDSSSAADFSTTSTTSSSSSSSTINVNKPAGMISIYATREQHEEIGKYLSEVSRISSAQVLIEAKVVEVTLNKDYETGIDWSWLDAGKSFSLNGSLGSESPVFQATIPKVKLFGLGGNLSASIKALEKFGTARSVSSPRVNAMNNQKASLDFSEKLIYFTLSVGTSQSASTTGTASVVTSTVTATKNEVDVGVKLDITPSINLETQEVTLNVSPNLSTDSGEVAVDPSVNPATGESLNNEIPIIRSRQLTTTAKIQSGSVLVIGGLMSETGSNSDTGTPLLQRIPILGNLFKYVSKSTSTVETVIFVKATIVNNSAPPNKYDRDFYDKFTIDKKSF
ncbi:MAG: hypothetical protein FJ368_05040 [Pelagibacterales bacterium]|nr:hypothetical protein [Pelagibacterales bacterium]